MSPIKEYKPANKVPPDIKTWKDILLYQARLKDIDILTQYYDPTNDALSGRDERVKIAKKNLLKTVQRTIKPDKNEKSIDRAKGGEITDAFQERFSYNDSPSKSTVLKYLQGTTTNWYKSRLTNVITGRLQPINPDALEPENILQEKLTIGYACDLISAEQLALQRSKKAKQKAQQAYNNLELGRPTPVMYMNASRKLNERAEKLHEKTDRILQRYSKEDLITIRNKHSTQCLELIFEYDAFRKAEIR